MAEIIAMIFEIFSSFLSIAWGVLPIIGMWLVFEKAGEAGWKSIIPFYNMYTMMKLGEKKQYWGLYIAGCIVYVVAVLFLIFYMAWFIMALVVAFGALDLGWDQLQALLPVAGFVGLGAIAGYIMMFIGMVQAYAGICKKMNQGAGMVVGLVLLSPVFWLLLGAGKEYQWEHSPKDTIPEWSV